MKKISCLIILFVLVFSLKVFGGDGYYPVYDDRSAIDIEKDEHPSYRKWCEENFELGLYVYEAYKKIVFGIKYKPELPGIDYWQTPIETFKLKSGDCEDVMFAFIDGLALSQKNAGIVWGWVIDKRTGSGKSTLTLALLRIIEPFRQSASNTTIDGVDINKLGLHHLRKNIAIKESTSVIRE